MFPLQIICLILDKQKAKAISNCGFSLAYIVDTKFIHNDIDSCGVKTRQHLGRWSWWREGDVVEGSLIGGGVRGGWRPEVQDVCIIYLETFSSSNPSAVLLPASLLPYWRRWNFDLGYALLGLFSMLALSCLCLAQVTICKHTVHLQGILQWWAPAL